MALIPFNCYGHIALPTRKPKQTPPMILNIKLD